MPCFPKSLSTSSYARSELSRQALNVRSGSPHADQRLPPRSPNLNAYAERFVRSIKEECLSKIIPIGERHLRRAIEEYAAHYHLERNHQGLGNRLIDGEPESLPVEHVECRERLGGILRSYHRAA